MSSRAELLGYVPSYVDPQTRYRGAAHAAAHPGELNPFTGTLNVPHNTPSFVRTVVSAGLTYGLTSALSEALPAPTQMPNTTAPLSTLSAPVYDEPVFTQTQQSDPMSIFSTITEALGAVGQAANLYRQYDASRSGAVAQPISMPGSIVSPLTLGALPAIGGAAAGAIGAIGAGAVRMGVAGARAVASSAMTYCRRHPQWCAGIGGSAAVAALIDSGQLPRIRRRRGRGLTPKDLRSFKRVANLIRVFAPTVRRIPARATRTGAHRHG